MTRGLLVAALVAAGCATPGAVLTQKGGLERAPSGATAAAGEPRRFALLVGIDTFDDPRFTSLRYAAADARDLGAALTGYHSVRVLTAREETLKATILAELEAIGREATHPQDTVVVYLSTHGTLARRPGAGLERFIVTRDTRFEVVADTGLPVERLRALLEAMPARRKALILALCHSGKGKSTLDDTLTAQLASTKGVARTFHDVSEGLLVLTACAFGETARESAELGHDVYTHGLLEALRLGDRDGDGAVTAMEAHDYARDATFAYTGGDQRPTAEIELVGRDPVVLTGQVLRTAAPVLFSYAPSAEGLRLRVDGAVKGALPGGVSLEPGRRLVSIEDARSGAVLAETTVLLGAGDRLDLSDVLPPPPAWLLGAEVTGAAALSSVVSSDATPPALGVRAVLARASGPLTARGFAGYRTGAGTLQGLGEGVPFRSHVLEAGVGVAWVPSPRLGLSLGLEGAWWFVVRDAATRDFRSVQTVGGPSGSLRLGWERRLGARFAVGAWVTGGVVAMPIENRLVASGLLGVDVGGVVVLP